MSNENLQPQRVKKKLPQNTEALLDELDSDPDLDAEALLKEQNPLIDDAFKDVANDFSNLNIEIEPLNLSGESQIEKDIKFTEKIKLGIKSFIKKIKNKFISLFFTIKYFLIWLITEAIPKTGKLVVEEIAKIKFIFKVFSRWSWKRRVLFILTFSMIGALSLLLIFMIKTNYLYSDKYQFLGSFAEVASNSSTYDLESDIELFYGSPRVKTYSYKLKPIVINLNRRRDSNRNPMGFFEFILDGSSGDVLVEVKSRETEIIDLIQRIVEKLDYEYLETPDGKLKLKETLKKELNKTLEDGSLKGVQIDNLIIKP